VDKSDFTATLISRDDPDFFRPLYVMDVDDATKTVVIKFPGAESGNYNIALVGKVVGRIDKVPLAITVTSSVTSISHASGSLHGGQLMTIGGVNFSNDKYDNPVKVGDYWCLVQTTSPTEITCRIMETFATEISTVNTLVFLRTSEEAKAVANNIFDFTEPLSAMTAMDNAFDATTNKQVVTLTGTGFPTDTAAVELMIDDVKQTTLTSTETTVTFSIDHMLDETSANVQVYFPDGFATGYADFKSVTVTPTLVSISPSSGSAGGTLLTVTGTGFGESTQGLGLVLESGDDICEEVKATGYGTFTCMTKVMEIESTAVLQLKSATGSYACGNTINAAECSYEQLNASSPELTGATVDSAT